MRCYRWFLTFSLKLLRDGSGRKLRGRLFQDLAALNLKYLKFCSLGRRQADKVFIFSFVVMDLLQQICWSQAIDALIDLYAFVVFSAAL